MSHRAFFALLTWLIFSSPFACAQQRVAADPLPSWNAGPAKKAILDFVAAVTDKGGGKWVAPAGRIATFDNDGTLWVEQPLYTQLVFAFDRVRVLAAETPAWKTKMPFAAVIDGDREAIAKFTKKDLIEILFATHAGMSAESFRKTAGDWLKSAKHPRFQRLYSECTYQPMLEMMRYLRANGFRTYIVTGGGQEFVRCFSDDAYGIPVDQVIGSAIRTKYEKKDGRPTLLRLPSPLLIDDEDGKPEDIELFLGRKPLAAFGNSNGDRQMLEWTQSGGGARLMMLIRHDDDTREYSYGPESKIGTFSDSLRDEAAAQGWHVVRMKNDWKRIFAFEK
jgi:phosphoserine phosphatase